jgi:predicted secreted Zn-dependent protease
MKYSPTFIAIIFCSSLFHPRHAIAERRTSPTSVLDRSSIKVPSQPQINLKFKYYEIFGKTQTHLRKEMNRLGPKNEAENRRYDAVTSWELHWEYDYVYSQKICRLSQVKVTIDVEILLPKWRPSAHTNPQLIDKWNRYLKALKKHESVHKQHGISAAQDLLASFRNFRAYPNCHKLKKAINSISYSIIHKYEQKDIQYDSISEHGVREGAVFP